MENILQTIKKSLADIYESEEAAAIAREISETCFHITPVQAYAGTGHPLSQQEREQLDQILLRLHRHEPLQYIIGSAYFMGHRFRVAPGVLIPRPETEDLVEQAIQGFKDYEAPTLIDAGTGSGCIAIALKLALPQARVTAIDCSDAALQQAEVNARELGAEVEFVKADLLRPETLPRLQADAIISNPPYVRESERAEMEPRVKDFEPELALFVPDCDALRFYRALAAWGQQVLNDGGRIFAEINSALPDETQRLFEDDGYRTTLLHDRYFKKRMLICQR